MARSEDPQTFGAGSEPEIASDHLSALEAGFALAPEFVLEDVQIAGASFAGVDAGSGRLAHVQLTDVDLRDSKLRGTRLIDVRGEAVDASNGDWRGAHMRRVLFSGCRLTGWNLGESNLEEVTFRDCKLDYASFRFAVLDRVSFEDCVLTDTDLQAVRCKSSRFAGCQLHGTDFNKAELDGVDLRGSDLRLTGGVEALRGAVVSTAQIIDLATPLAEAAGIVVADD
jgi:uncharacterized protein YjbI with pentapeptide repeats